MEYTVQKLGKMAGVSTRTLRYYDEIGILKPARINSSGYRIYSRAQVDRLQQILFYRELGVSLENIKTIITEPSFNRMKALKEHKEKLLEKRNQLDLLIANVDKTIAVTEGGSQMSDKEKFKGFKKNMIEENERKYGKEIREKYGEKVVKDSNEKFMNMSKEEYDEVTRLAEEINSTLAEAMKTGDPAGELAQKTASLHKKWLCYYWTEYSEEAHGNLSQMYVDDERFKAYYDAVDEGAAEFLRDAVFIFTGRDRQ